MMLATRAQILAAHNAGYDAGVDGSIRPTACPYPRDRLAERRIWLRAFTRGRIAGKLTTPSEIAEQVDDDADVDPAILEDEQL